MKVSLNTIRGIIERYNCAEDVTAIGVDALVDKIGAQLGAVEEVIPFGEKYQGIVIVRVVTVEPHPNADRLKVCIIDDGGNSTPDVKRDENGHVQVVCGAPNVRAGMLAAWLPPGSTVPETVGKDPFVLEARELRGVVSNGMLASAKELALGDSHDGILEIDGDYQPGTDFAEAFGLKNDVVLDLENKMFTHRPDCFGFLGIARELAGIQQLPFKSPEWYIVNPTFPEVEAELLPLQVVNELPELVPRFSTIALRGVEVGPSPVWLQVELAKVGLRSNNNIVDYTNWFMLETGQPLHAYDYDKVAALSDAEGAKIVVRNPHEGETVKLLNGKEIEPRRQAIMIATDRQAIGLGGVMGGAETEVDETTRRIIIECANFDMYSIRRTAMAHGLFTDAVTRFNKGQSPLQTLSVLARIVEEIRAYAGGKVASPLIDDQHLEETETMGGTAVHQPVEVRRDFIITRLGLELSNEEIVQLLRNVEFIADAASGGLLVQAPFWRTDIELPEDIVEEVGRLYGYDKLPLQLPHRDLTPVQKGRMLELKAQIRAFLSRAGANEVLTYSFVPGDLLDKVGQDKSQAFQISNALSPDLQYYRLSLTPSLLEKVHPNLKAGYDEFALFELGKAHNLTAQDEAGLPKEYENLAFVYAAQKPSRPGAAYYEAKKFLNYLFGEMGQRVELMPDFDTSRAANVSFVPGRSAQVQLKGTGKVLGMVGEFTPTIRRALKLPEKTAGFEINLGTLMAALTPDNPYKPLSRFPKIMQDISLRVRANLSYAELSGLVYNEIQASLAGTSYPTVVPLDIYQSADDQSHKNITLRLSIASYDRTLTDTEVNKMLDAVAAAAAEKYGAERL